MIGFIRVMTLVVVLAAQSAVVQGQVWTARWSGPEADLGFYIARDSTGNVFVSGSSYLTGQRWDIATVKYDPDGNEMWSARYDYERKPDEPNDMTVDRFGNVYVTGYSNPNRGSLATPDYVTIKYRPDGQTAWIARYGHLEQDDRAYALTVDTLCNVYVTGGSNGDLTTLKYDSSGTLVWEARYGALQDWANDVCLDPSGNVYVAGRVSDGGQLGSGRVIKYGADGNEIWVSSDTTGFRGVAVDEVGNVYVVGSRPGTLRGDMCLVKYDSLGRKLRKAVYDGPAQSDDKGEFVALGGGGAVYVAGISVGLGRGYDYCVIRYDSAGNEIWVARHDGGDDWLGGFAFNGKDLCVVGTSSSAYCTAVFGTDGGKRWVAYSRESRYCGAFGVVADADGYVYVTGHSGSDGGTQADFYTIKYSPGGVSVSESRRRPRRSAAAWPSHVASMLTTGEGGHLLDAHGRKALRLREGNNDVGYLAPGVYFVRAGSGDGRMASRKVVVTR